MRILGWAMVLVTWDQETGELKEVQQGDGPGEYTDDVDADTVKKRLRDVDSINEEIIAGVIMSAYDGRLMEFSYQATVDTFENSPNSDIDGGRSVTTIGFVEVCDEESKLDLISCDSCDYSPSSANEWIFDIS